VIETVVASRYLVASDASIAAGALSAAGIDAHVVADDCGGMRPEFHPARPLEVRVALADGEAARSFLAEVEGGFDPEEHEAAVPASFRWRPPVLRSTALLLLFCHSSWLHLLILYQFD
jgi:hypothetical protein